MPSTPSSCKACFTASSLAGWMIASTLVIVSGPFTNAVKKQITYATLSRPFPVVAFLSVLREVQPLRLLLLGDAQANRLINNEQNYKRAHDGQGPCDCDSYCLISQLPKIAFQ